MAAAECFFNPGQVQEEDRETWRGLVRGEIRLAQEKPIIPAEFMLG